MFMSHINKNWNDSGEQSYYILMDEISMETCQNAISWILEANFAEKRPEVLNLFICSPGGDVSAAFALIDIMRGSSIPVRTIGIGEIASCGLIIFLAGKKGERILTPNTTILSHQYAAGSMGKHHELMSTVKQFNITDLKILNHYMKYTGLNEEEVRTRLLPPHDVWLSAAEAKGLGICDKVKELN